ncbi:hypothetical protein BREVUG8_40202 [Brevundimonas sp. G8]|nr:hypothetical protein BREVUG8_40202 [Brevundimonas sp. G8]
MAGLSLDGERRARGHATAQGVGSFQGVDRCPERGEGRAAVPGQSPATRRPA